MLACNCKRKTSNYCEIGFCPAKNEIYNMTADLKEDH